MKSRGIIFQAESIRGILSGTKTQTRRVCKVQPAPWQNHYQEGGCHVSDWKPAQCEDGTWDLISGYADNSDKAFGRCPYGEPGDLLWCREAWALPQGTRLRDLEPDDHITQGHVLYRADWERDEAWSSPLFMPRWASRITLELTDVRVQRLHDITEQDAIAEGCVTRTYRDGRGFEPARLDYERLWDSINGKKHPWMSNPFCWALTFRRIK